MLQDSRQFAGRLKMKALILLLFVADAIAGPYDDLINVAVGKPARQKDTLDLRGNASLANDGNANPDYNKSSCAHSSSTSQTWWAVDFLRPYTIQAVNLTNRNMFGERLSNFNVYVTLQNPLNGSQLAKMNADQQCFFRQKMIPQGLFEVVNCTKPISGRYLVVYKATDSHLAICELGALAKRISNAEFRRLQNFKISGTPFFSTNNIATATSCLVRCSQVPKGQTTTGVNYLKAGGKCECMTSSGFETSPPAQVASAGWSLYLAK